MAAAWETEGNKTVSEWSGTRGQRPISLSARLHEQPSVGGTRWVPLSCQRHPEVWVSLGVRPAGSGMREMACTRSWSRRAASGAPVSCCQQLGRLGSRGNWGLGRVCEPSRRIYPVHAYTCTQSHCWASVLLSQSGEQDEAAGAVFVQLLSVPGWSVICAAGTRWCVVHSCALCKCWLGMCWALLLVGPGAMQLWQPHWATLSCTSGLIPLIFLC